MNNQKFIPFLKSLQSPLGLVLIIIAFAAGLRLYSLDSHHLWIDEVFTGVFANPQNSFAEVLDWAYNEPYTMAPLIFIAENILMRIFGESIFVLRLFGAITGTIAVFVSYKLGEVLYNSRVGIIAALLMAVSPFPFCIRVRLAIMPR